MSTVIEGTAVENQDASQGEVGNVGTTGEVSNAGESAGSGTAAATTSEELQPPKPETIVARITELEAIQAKRLADTDTQMDNEIAGLRERHKQEMANEIQAVRDRAKADKASIRDNSAKAMAQWNRVLKALGAKPVKKTKAVAAPAEVAPPAEAPAQEAQSQS